MRLLLDAGALVAIERADRFAMGLVKDEADAGRTPVTHGGIIGQVWRGGSGKQARLASFLPSVEVVPLDEELGQRAGVLLGRARKTDVVDAALVLLATDGDTILTSDVDDLEALAAAAGLHVDIIHV